MRSVATIVPRGWEIPAAELIRATSASCSRRSGRSCTAPAKDASGGLIAFLHGECEPTRDIYQLHLRVLVASGMIDVLNCLRTRRNYRWQMPKPGGPHEPVSTRVQIKRDELTELPCAFSYLFKSL